MTTTYHNPGNSFWISLVCPTFWMLVVWLMMSIPPAETHWSEQLPYCNDTKDMSLLQGTPFFHGSMVCNPTSPTAGERSTFHLHYFQSFAHYEAAKYLWLLMDAEASGENNTLFTPAWVFKLKKQPFSKGFPNIANETPQWSMLHGFIPKGFDESELGQACPVARNNTHLLWPRIHGWFRVIGMAGGGLEGCSFSEYEGWKWEHQLEVRLVK